MNLRFVLSENDYCANLFRLSHIIGMRFYSPCFFELLDTS